jgi:hypothetical protein
MQLLEAVAAAFVSSMLPGLLRPRGNLPPERCVYMRATFHFLVGLVIGFYAFFVRDCEQRASK